MPELIQIQYPTEYLIDSQGKYAKIQLGAINAAVDAEAALRRWISEIKIYRLTTVWTHFQI